MASRDGRRLEVSAQNFADPSLLSLARQTQQARINCSQHFPKNVFRDSAWDIMLELFIVAEEGGRMCVKDTMAISGESATGTIRRIEGLEEAKLIVRRYDPVDHRRMLVELSGKGRAAMVSFLHHLFEVGEAASKADQPVKPVTFVPLAPRRPNDDLRDRS
ncbi:MarR family winged helix-turn-helix transcriptional regulator [Sphingobium sp. CR2-8]|uniref:MarR family winged helix-turn-helix transcriptional regulator n=1 Tax=Sphingobium sp. CR2-8 TaxID=1306534 RepID=UPI002DBC2618|nr:MarR family winged helix-turn-helix transcriptional regulator [Sphingobium sp. CR2-8]MEC3910178.1 MarR family winged helix-turn-helix transcriptional regulator [Sphingobium sp. CR2-8]